MTRLHPVRNKSYSWLACGLLAIIAIVLGAKWKIARDTGALVTNQATTSTDPTQASNIAASKDPAPNTVKPTPKPVVPKHTIARWAQGRIINDVPVRRGNKVFALTFDDGPWPQYTSEILDILASRGVKATFFMVGQEVERRPELVRAIMKAGHDIGNHSWQHPSRPRRPAMEVTRTGAALKKITGYTPRLFRPPYGLVRNGMAAQAMREKQCVVLWTADSNDWKRISSGSIANRILRQASPGGIALFHDGGGHRAATVASLPRIIDTLHERGYRFVTVTQLLEMRYIAPRKVKPKPKAKNVARATKTSQPIKKPE